MLLQTRKLLCQAPEGARSILKYLEALARATGVSGRFAYGLLTELHFVDGLIFRFPSRLFILLRQTFQWFRFLRIRRFILPITIAKPQNLLYFNKIIQSLILSLLLLVAVPLTLNLIGIH
jgi:hypothetical protein